MAGKNPKKPPLIAARGLGIAFDTRPVLAGVSLQLHGGECLIVTGDNGAGKTTLLRCLAGLIAPDTGDITRPGASTQTLYIGHRNGLAAELTAAESLRLWANARGFTPSTNILKRAFAMLGIDNIMDTPCRNLSAGLQRRVALTRAALMQKKSLWLLDEPLTAVDTKTARDFLGLIKKHRAGGGGVVITAHGKIPIPNARVMRMKKPEPRLRP